MRGRCGSRGDEILCYPVRHFLSAGMQGCFEGSLDTLLIRRGKGKTLINKPPLQYKKIHFFDSAVHRGVREGAI